jgi:glutamyl-tRNA reductase
VQQVLTENDTRWESLAPADRERLELVAATIVKRLLREPTLRLKARGDDRRTYAYVQALRELFGLEAESRSAFERAPGEPAAEPERGARVTPIRRTGRRGRR